MKTSLITPDQVRTKALRKWKDGTFLRYVLLDYQMAEESTPRQMPRLNFFPMNIPFKTPSSRVLSDHFMEIKEGINKLKAASKAVKGNGYTVYYRDTNHRTLGMQKVPERITLETQEDFLVYLGIKKTFQACMETIQLVLNRMPKLYDLLVHKPHIILDYHNHWTELLAICDYFVAHPKPSLFVRQLDIPGVDTKFIEKHRGILDQLLQNTLPDSSWDSGVKGLAHYGFERKYGLLFPEALIRFRLLDSSEQGNPFADTSLPISQFVKLAPPISRVFITENKVNGLSFPCVSDAMVIFGLGYGIRALKKVTWIQKKTVYYWGDIDSHGFNILAQVRRLFPQTISIMMDMGTLNQFKKLSVTEPEATRFSGTMDGLTQEEKQTCSSLRQTGESINGNATSVNLRLEQERIPYSWVEKTIGDLV